MPTALHTAILGRGALGCVCEAITSFQHVDPDIALRQLDLIRAAISTPVPSSRYGATADDRGPRV